MMHGNSRWDFYITRLRSQFVALTTDNRINLYRSINLSDIAVTFDPDRFAWRQASQRSLLFQFAVNRGTRVLVQSVAVDIKAFT